GVVDSRRDCYPLIAVGHGVGVVVFGDDGLVTIRRTVFPYVPRAEIRGNDFQVTGAGRASSGGGSILPTGDRMSLPGRFPRGRRVEMKSPGLVSRIRVDMKRGVVFPSDMQPPRQPHNAGCAVGL